MQKTGCEEIGGRDEREEVGRGIRLSCMKGGTENRHTARTNDTIFLSRSQVTAR